jgi:sugar-phosphatase
MAEITRQLSVRAVLFDLDGVLVDSTDSVGRVWRDWAVRHGFDPEAVIHSAHGRRSIETVREWAPHLDAEKENAIIERAEIEDTRDLTVIAGAAQLLATLPPERWAVVTSGTRALATSRLKAVGLPVPKALITADEVRNGKPSPEPYLKGAKLVGFAPEDCLVFEDTPPGIEAAHAAGMRCVALTTTYEREKLTTAEATITDFRDISFSLANCSQSLVINVSSARAQGI